MHYAIPHSVAALLARQMLAAKGRHLPFITTLHGTDITLVGLDRSYLPITKFGIEQSDGVTAISDYLRERTREAFGIASEIEVIHNFVNCDVYVRKPELVAEMRAAICGAGGEAFCSSFEFSSGEASDGCGRGVCAGGAGVAGAADADRRWARTGAQRSIWR